ncbi:hypothetical protein TYRP_016916 [Tyrophagus putrescentiae]|nr:hypothetical protein TYRP_016916 [Tyrophagus putrescentiae]
MPKSTSDHVLVDAQNTSDHVLVDDPKVPLIMSSLTTKSTSDHVLVDAQKYL